jgi:hypothetical protein
MTLSPDLFDALNDAHHAFEQLTLEEQEIVMETTPTIFALLMGDDCLPAAKITARVDDLFPASVHVRRKLQEIPELK